MENFYYLAEMRQILTTTLFSIFICLFVSLLWTRRKLYYASYKLPGPIALPLIGNLYNFVGVHSTGEDIFNRLTGLFAEWGSTLRFWAGPKLFIAVSKPEDLKTIFTHPDCLHRDLFLMKGVVIVLGNGLLVAEVPIWRAHRKLINPIFNTINVNGFFDAFSCQAKQLSENLREKVGKGIFDITPLVSKAAVQLIYETTMGDDTNSCGIFDEKLVKYLDEIMDISLQRITKGWLFFDFIFNLTKQGHNFEKCLGFLLSLPDMVIKKKRKEMKLKENTITNENNKKDLDTKTPKKKIFIDLLLELHENGIGFTDKEVKDEILTFIIAGSDTVTNTISFACLALAANPECQEKVYAEIKKVLGDSNRDLALEDISQLKYLERVIKETLRLFPQVPFLLRSMKKDVQFADVVAPAGATILYTNFFTQRDPKVWPDPLKFDPDRFLPEAVSRRHPYSYVPFGGGFRKCIGYRYAMLLIKVIISTLIRTYKFKSTVDLAKIRLTVKITMKAAEGCILEVEPRNK